MTDIDPKVWGSAGWVFLRNIAKGYPDKPTPTDKLNYKTYFESMENVLPCSTCRKNYKIHIKQIPISNHLGNKTQLLNWVNTIRSKSKPKIVTRPRQMPPTTIQQRINRIKKNRQERVVNAKNRKCKRCGAK